MFAAGAGPGSGPERKRTVDYGAAVKLIEAAKELGVARYVMVSSMGTFDIEHSPEAMRPYFQAKRDADDALEASGLDWTIVRPGHLTDDPGTGRVDAARALGRTGEVPREDVAAVLVECLQPAVDDPRRLRAAGRRHADRRGGRGALRFFVEPSPAGGYFVRAEGVAAPVSRHDTEEEAEEAAQRYSRGVERGDRRRRVAAGPMSDGFGLENLPFGVVSPGGCAVRYGDRAVLLAPLEERLGVPPGTFSGPVLNPFLALGRDAWSRVRSRLPSAIGEGVPLSEVEVRMPVAIGDYVDFYSSIEHATNVGRIFRPEAEPLLPNWRHLPVGYHGRASTVVVSGTPVRRPVGQLGEGRFGPCERLDIELELGFIRGPGDDGIFGFVLVNDWSARDIQAWENRPLGPFLSKSFATSISPWIVPLDALQPFRVPGPPQDPPPLPYLRMEEDWALDIDLEVVLVASGLETVVSRTNARTLYWSAPQQLAHATLNGCRRGPATCTRAARSPAAEPGSLLELSWNGRDPITLAGGETRTFLQDGDEVILRGHAGPVSLGEVRGTILPADERGPVTL